MINDTLQDLYNPNKITAVTILKGKTLNFYPYDNNRITISKGVALITAKSISDIGFQEYPKSVEMWAQLPDGKMIKLKRWLKSTIYSITYDDGGVSIIKPFTYSDGSISVIRPFKPYIYPKTIK